MLEALTNSEYFINSLATLVLIAPGYICYSITEMWVHYREKSQFEKVLNSLVFSGVLWFPIWVLWGLLAKYKNITAGGMTIILTIGMVILVFLLAWIMARIEHNGWLFKIEEFVRVSTKISHKIVASLCDSISINFSLANITIDSVCLKYYLWKTLRDIRKLEETNCNTCDISDDICSHSIKTKEYLTKTFEGTSRIINKVEQIQSTSLVFMTQLKIVLKMHRKMAEKVIGYQLTRT
jgi:hypothetical protein